MAINLYMRLMTSEADFQQMSQHYKEAYRFLATDGDESVSIKNYRIRHFLTANTPNSTVTPNSGLMVYDGNGMTRLTGSYNDWTNPNRPPKFDGSKSKFNTELIMRFDDDRPFSSMPNNTEAWITAPYAGDNGIFSPSDVEDAFSFLGYSNSNEYVKNPMNVVLEHKIAGGDVSRIYTDPATLPSGRASSCSDDSDLYKVETVVVETDGPHGLQVGDAVTLYSRSVSDVPVYTERQGRLFGKAPGERYLGDFIVIETTETSFKYKTYHNPLKINALNHPEYTHATWSDLVWERWVLYEYTESVSAAVDGSAVTFTFTGTDPSGISCRRNFAENDNVTFQYNSSYQVHMVVTSVSSNGITAVPVDGETFPTGVTSGTLVYTPRVPSSDVAFNVVHDEIAPQKVKSHSKDSAIFYACQDTYYASNDLNVSNGEKAQLYLTGEVYLPIIKFPVPYYGGDAEPDPDMVARMYIYALSAGGTGNNTLELYDFGNDTWTESDVSRVLSDIRNGSWNGYPVGSISEYSYGNPSRTFTNKYVQFYIDNEHMVKMFTARGSNTIFIKSLNGAVNVSDPIKFASRENDDGLWPYIAVNSPKYIGVTPTIDIYNTYMYLVCDSIKKTTLGSVGAFVATISPKFFDASSLLNVRSWDADKPFFAFGDKIEIMNSDHYDTGRIVDDPVEGKKKVTATVLHVEYSEHKVYFKYNNDWDPGDHGEEGGIIRNLSRMISTYKATDAENEPSNLGVDGPEWYGKYGYVDGFLQFDVIHDEATDDNSSLSVVYNNGVNQSNEVNPVILTDIDVVVASEESTDRETDRFSHVGPNNRVILKGFNFDKLNKETAKAVLGHPRWEDGIATGGVPVSLRWNNDEPYFDYDHLDLQKSMPVYGIRNDENGVTEFKVKASDYPFCGPGDIVAAIYTGEYSHPENTDAAEDAELPEGLVYGRNYYVVNVVEDSDGPYYWLRLSSTYIFRYEWLTPTYVSLSPEDVEYIEGIIDEGGNPVVLYNTVTSVTIEDTNCSTTDYANRLYLQIDEEPPICYIPEKEHHVDVPFDVYISDLNEIDNIDGNPLSNYNVEYLLGGNDSRFIKLTLTLNRSTVIDIYDVAGNHTALPLAVIDTKIDLTLMGFSSTGDTHTLSFKVSDSDYRILSTSTQNPGVSGIWAMLGNAYLDETHFTNISPISHSDDGRGNFTFDLVISDDELSQRGGRLEVLAGDTNEGALHQTAKWTEPVIFQKAFSCTKSGDVLAYRGVNLYETDNLKLRLCGTNWNYFSIDSVDSVTAANISIKVVTTKYGTHSFDIRWVEDGSKTRPYVEGHEKSVSLIPGPIIYYIDTSLQTVKLAKGTPWVEPEPKDIYAEDGLGKPISYTSQVLTDNQEWWKEPGRYTIRYTAEDSCHVTADLDRTVIVTECDIPIILVKKSDDEECPTFDTYEDIEIMIAPESTVRFNQNFMNNVVEYRLPDSEEWITAIILAGTPDRERLTIKNPGVIANDIKLRVDVGGDNSDVITCSMSDPVCLNLVSKEEQDKPLDVDGKASIVKKKNSVSRFDDLNFEPIYNKDLAYSSFSITADENSLMQNVYSILLTNLGERLYDDEFGSTLEESVFDIIGDLNGESKLLNQCVTLINKYEPRVVVVEDKSYVAINEDNTVVIVLYIKVPRGIARKIELTFRNDS